MSILFYSIHIFLAIEIKLIQVRHSIRTNNRMQFWWWKYHLHTAERNIQSTFADILNFSQFQTYAQFQFPIAHATEKSFSPYTAYIQ